MKYGFVLFSLLLSLGTVRADVPACWVPAGNEMQDIVDSESGKTVRYLTVGNTVDSHFHYHNGTWGFIGGKQYVFLTSSRPRPAGAGETKNGERQIMAADVETGDLFYLLSIPMNASSRTEHIGFRPYFASYNDTVKMIFTWDRDLKNIYAFNCLTGEQKIILSLPEGTMARQLDEVVDDGILRFVYTYSEAGKGDSLVIADFDLDLNPIATKQLAQCEKGDALNHAEMCPTDKNLLYYQHRQGDLGNGKYEKDSVYILNLANGDKSELLSPDNSNISHFVWGRDTPLIAWCNSQSGGNVYFHHLDTGKTEIAADVHALHNQLSGDETLWVLDQRTHQVFKGPIDGVKVENWDGRIKIYNHKTGKSTLYANIIWAGPHPRHPHPMFSADSKWISFVTGSKMDNIYSRVAVMKVDEE